MKAGSRYRSFTVAAISEEQFVAGGNEIQAKCHQAQRRTTSGAIWPNGSTRSTPPSLIASAGMPKTIEVAWSCARLKAPVSFSSSMPRAPFVAHAGHDPARRVPSGVTRRGTEQDVHRRAVAADQRPVPDFDV